MRRFRLQLMSMGVMMRMGVRMSMLFSVVQPRSMGMFMVMFVSVLMVMAVLMLRFMVMDRLVVVGMGMVVPVFVRVSVNSGGAFAGQSATAISTHLLNLHGSDFHLPAGAQIRARLMAVRTLGKHSLGFKFARAGVAPVLGRNVGNRQAATLRRRAGGQ